MRAFDSPGFDAVHHQSVPSHRRVSTSLGELFIRSADASKTSVLRIAAARRHAT